MIDAINSSKPATSATSDPSESRLRSTLEHRIEEDRAARKVAQFPGPKELARDTTSPVGAEENAARTERRPVPQSASEERTSIRDIANRKQLLSLSPEQEIEVFSAARDGRPVERRERAEISSERTAQSEPARPVSNPEPFSPVREIQEISRESSETEFDKINVRQALENISRAVPAKAGALLDIAV